MKIVTLHTDFRLYWPARMKALHTFLRKRGDTLEVIEIAGCGSPYAFATKEKTNELPWHILFPKDKPEDLSGRIIRPHLFRLLDSLNPDIIIAGAIAFPSGALAVQWGQKHSKRIIIFDDAKINAVPRSGLVNFIKKSVYHGVDAMFYPAPDWKETGYFWGFNDKQMFFGIDVVDNNFWSTPKQLEYNWGNYFLAVGRQIPKKNFSNIIKAYKKYLNKIGREQAYKLIMIGEGEEHHKIVKFIEEHQLQSKVILLPFQSQEKLPAIYQHAKAFCINSNEEETWGLVINEAMAGGCPILASSQCGASGTLVKHGINGYTFDYTDIDKLASFMADFTLLSEEKKQNMKNASRNIIKDWGIPRFVNGAIEAIDSVTSKPKAKVNLIENIIIHHWYGRYRPI